MRRTRNSGSAVWRGAAAALIVGVSGHAAAAQDVAAPRADAPGWQFSISPYVWIAGVSGTIKTPVPGAPGQSVDAGFGNILSHLDAIPIMGAAELRYGRLGLLTDIIAISVQADIPTQGLLFSGGSAKLTQVIGTALGAYRVLDDGRHSLDLGVGVRAFGMSTKFTLNGALLPGFSVSPGADWADPIGGGRYHIDLNEKWGLTAYADAGGGPNGQVTWQVLGTVDYRIGDSADVRLGFRHLQFEYEGRRLHQNMGLSGPILAGTLRF